MSHLFSELALRELTLPNRVAVSPMCQYSSIEGYATDWHLVHLGSRAVGGASIVFTEAAAVLPEGRISPQDLGIWDDGHVEKLSRITTFIHEQGGVAGMQLAHAGRKASTKRPWDGDGAVVASDGGWTPLAPTAVKFTENYPLPAEMTRADIEAVTVAFANAARRSHDAGFKLIELHAAHGYLFHEFFSPLSNLRSDEYGGSFQNRTRILRDVVSRVRTVWPDRLPLFVRISATEWAESGGWDIEESIELARNLKVLGVDLIDCSSGGGIPQARMPIGPGYQTSFAERIRREAGIATGAVGMITSPVQADHIIRTGQADLVLIAREMLRDPYWVLRASRKLAQPTSWPVQYVRAGPKDATRRAPQADNSR